MGKYSRVVLAVSLLVSPFACGVEGPPDEPVADPGDGSTPDPGSDPGETTPNEPGTDPDPPAAEPSCENPPEPLDPELLEVCPTELCGGGGRCLPVGLVVDSGGQEQADMLAECAPDVLCVPDDFVASQGFFTPASCSSVLGAEGRCLSLCIPEVKTKNAEVALPQDVCAAYQVCVPCYDPQTGDSTDACDLACDAGPVEPPTVLPSCCGGHGKCVPSTAVPADQVSQLGDYGCLAEAGPDFICAPNVFIENQNYAPPGCTDLPFLLTLTLPSWAQDGVCLPDCLPALDDSPVSLQQGACGQGNLCAPCYRPGGLLGLGPPESTGACDL
jgi:hypothetical protein